MKLTCSLKPKSPNRLKGHHWGTYHKHRQEVRDRLWFENEELRRLARGVTRYWPVEPPLRVTYELRYARTPRDLDNVAASVKPVLDALKHLGVIEDDKPAIVAELVTKQTKVAHVKDEGFTIELTTLEED